MKDEGERHALLLSRRVKKGRSRKRKERGKIFSFFLSFLFVFFLLFTSSRTSM
jgi:hypothetical protein